MLYTTMDNEVKRFLIKILYSLVIIGVIGAIIFSTFLKKYYSHSYFILLAIVIIVITLSYSFLINTIRKAPDKFPRNFSQMTLLKILVFLGLLTPLFIVRKNEALQLASMFFIFYLTYTILEVVSLQNFLKKKS